MIEPDVNDPIDFIRSLVRSESTVLIGLGNPDRADDGAGIQIVSKWKARYPKRAFLDTERSVESAVLDNLENASFEAFLFVDAADFGGITGEFRLFHSGDAGRFHPALSTHKVPMDLLMQLIASKGKKAYLLGIQAGSVEFPGEISKEVRETISMFDFSGI